MREKNVPYQSETWKISTGREPGNKDRVQTVYEVKSTERKNIAGCGAGMQKTGECNKQESAWNGVDRRRNSSSKKRGSLKRLYPATRDEPQDLSSK